MGALMQTPRRGLPVPGQPPFQRTTRDAPGSPEYPKAARDSYLRQETRIFLILFAAFLLAKLIAEPAMAAPRPLRTH